MDWGNEVSKREKRNKTAKMDGKLTSHWNRTCRRRLSKVKMRQWGEETTWRKAEEQIVKCRWKLEEMWQKIFKFKSISACYLEPLWKRSMCACFPRDQTKQENILHLQYLLPLLLFIILSPPLSLLVCLLSLSIIHIIIISFPLALKVCLVHFYLWGRVCFSEFASITWCIRLKASLF